MQLIVKEKYKQLHISPRFGGIRTTTISDASESDKNENNE